MALTSTELNPKAAAPPTSATFEIAPEDIVLLPADEQGRVRIPDAMIEHAGLKDKVAFLGLSQKFQIWDAERLAAVEQERLQRKLRQYEMEQDGKSFSSDVLTQA